MILSLLSLPLPPSLPLCAPFPLPSFLWAFHLCPVLGGKGRRGNVLLWGGGRGGGGVLSHPVPSFPLRRKILAQGGSVLVSLYLVLVVLAHISQSVLDVSFTRVAGLMASAGAAVVDHACSARHQTKGSGPGLVPLHTCPHSWGEGGVCSFHPLHCQVSFGASPRAHGALGVISGLPWAVVGCPLFLCACVRSAIAGVDVAVALASWLGLLQLGHSREWRQRCGWWCCLLWQWHSNQSKHPSPDGAASAIGDPVPQFLVHLWFSRRQHQCPTTQ